MKDKALNIFISALFTISAFFFAADFCLAEEKSITQPVTVSALSGKVEVLPKDALNWQEAEIGIKLFEGDKIRTAEDGKAELTFKDGSFIRMKPNTTLGVLTVRQEISTEVRHYNLELRVGEIMAEVQKLKKGSSFEVQTPTAVAAVRGTTYYMRTGTRIVDGVEKSFVEIFIDSDDTILFTNTVSGESCVVTQGQGTIVYDDGTTEGPFDIPPEEQDAWKSGFDMVYEDGKGMRDVDEEGGEGDDTSGDVDDTLGDQNDSQNDANQDQTGEQELAKVDIITDTDGDGYLDADDAFPTDPTEWLDTDGDGTGNNADTDDDGDKYSDSDETDNETDPLDAASVPSDNDIDYISDLNDPDDDDDGILDSWEIASEDSYETNYLLADTDSDTFDDFEDAFPNNAYNPTVDESYGSWDQLREATLDNLAMQLQKEENLELRQDISVMIDDIHARGFEAAKENIFDHQAGKVMTDRWGNRVRVEEYVSKPTNKQVQILALNLRTAGPNAGISSLDFRVRFREGTDISNTDLTTLPWDDYMDNPQNKELDWTAETKPDADDEAQLILYDQEPTDYPLPLEFSLEAKNPYGDSVKFAETYSNEVSSGIIEFEGGAFATAWYQVQRGANIRINDDPIQEYVYYEGWAKGSNQLNKFTFFDNEFVGKDKWLFGAFYLIDNEGQLVDKEQENKDYLDELNGIRDLINPDFNMEMVFLSSEFTTVPELPMDMKGKMDSSYSFREYSTYGSYLEAYLEENYDDLTTIDVITIPEITEPYGGFNRSEAETPALALE